MLRFMFFLYKKSKQQLSVSRGKGRRETASVTANILQHQVTNRVNYCSENIYHRIHHVLLPQIMNILQAG